MQLIHYADGSVLTGSSIARALVDYAQVLAANGSAAAVDIPTREKDGTIGRATFLLGPASQMVSVEMISPFDEVEDEPLVTSLQEETRRQRGSEVLPSDQDPYAAPSDLEWEQ
jgi:hypothetical protein